MSVKLNMRSKQWEDERFAREKIEASLAKEEKKRAALKRHLKNKLKEQMKEFEEERRKMAKKYEQAMDAARIAEDKQKSQLRDSAESKRARNEMVSLASAQSSDAAVKKLEKELAKMRTQLELQRQHTQDARKEVVQMREEGVKLNLTSQVSNASGGVVHLTPRHEKMQKMHIQHEVEREQHHERVRSERERQKAELRERLERKKQRPHTTSMAPGQRPGKSTSAWGSGGGEDGRRNEGTKVGKDNEGSGGRGTGEGGNWGNSDARHIRVRSRRPVVDFTEDDDF